MLITGDSVTRMGEKAGNEAGEGPDHAWGGASIVSRRQFAIGEKMVAASWC